MIIATNVTTRRGLGSILPLLQELEGRGHDVRVLVTTQPSDGLKVPYQFMIGENKQVYSILQENDIRYEVDPNFQPGAIVGYLKQWSPDVYITKQDSGSPRDNVICQLVRRHLPHTMLVACQCDYHMRINHPSYSSRWMVMGPRWRRHLVEEGIDDDAIEAVGFIRGDYLLSLNKRSTRLITFFSQMLYTDEQKRGILGALYNVARDTNHELVIKLHPAWAQWGTGDEPGWWTNEVSLLEPSIPVHISEFDDPYELMLDSACIVTGFSNTGFEAMYMGIPAVLINITGDTAFYNGCGIDVYHPDEIEPMVLSVLNKDPGLYPTTRSWLLDQVTTIGNGASRRTADLIEGWAAN